MDKLKVFENLEQEYLKLVEEVKDYKEKMTELEQQSPEEVEMYEKLNEDKTPDEVLKRMCPRMYELSIEKKKIEDIAESFEDTLKKRASELKKDMEVEIAEVKTKLEKNENHLAKIEKEIKDIKAEMKAIKASEEYKNNDTDAVLRYKDLEAELNAKQQRRFVINEDIKDYKAEIEEIEQDIKELVEKYLKDEEPDIGQPDNGQPDNGTPDNGTPDNGTPDNGQPDNGQPDNGTPDNGTPDKGQQSKSGPDNGEPGKGEPDNGKDEFEKIKKQYEEIIAKKPEDITMDESIILSNILSDKENYEKLGIRTGRVFNDSKKILKKIAKAIAATNRIENIDMTLRATKSDKLLPYTMLNSWKGIKAIAGEENNKLALEQTYKNVKEHYKNDLDNPESKKIYEQAVKGLEEIEALRKAVKTNDEVTEKRRESKSFNIFGKKEDKKMLQSAPEPQQAPEPAPSLADVKKGVIDMSNMTNPPSQTDVDLAENTKGAVVVDEQTK